MNLCGRRKHRIRGHPGHAHRLPAGAGDNRCYPAARACRWVGRRLKRRHLS
ncbi:hypothetical protein NBRC3257_0310 [Gluconobacter thailandicus NBRC 3257]|uniref:Uncharacterized protein n=1 Tax=Gluconobacter thailandicus NBRC 3257 TaxID=1381097 RepID=A0ABQ0ISW9_GLUTH|nr:hypothetical protein B932_3054 [Gluconobacter oxydans H24]GAD25311.1 hypothetical protein NBRC3257_0310 [Gluconobacter thailandicus NBRC 3257]